jgi:hypothetical protein
VPTDRAPEAPKSPNYGVFEAHSGAEAAIEGVFQQAAPFPDVECIRAAWAAYSRRGLGRAKHLSPPVLEQLALLALSGSS